MAKPKISLVNKEPIVMGATPEESEKPKGKSKKKKSGEKDAEKKLPPRKRVREAQLHVLDQVDNILKGNCGSATKGNYGCAKFVLDWSGVSDLRSPLAKPLKKKSVASALLKKLTEAAAKQEKAEQPALAK